MLFNRAAEQMFGYSAQEAIGQPLDRFVPARFRDVHRHHIHTFGQSGVTSRKMGKLGTSGTPLERRRVSDRSRHFAYRCGRKEILYRHSSRHHGAQAGRRLLHESQRQLTTLIGNLPGFVYRCRNDRGWIFEYLSDGVSDLTGYTREEYLVQRNRSLTEHTRP